MTHPRVAALAACLLVVPLLAGCGDDRTASHHITVLAAASLAGPVEAVAVRFRDEHPDTSVRLSFAGTPTLLAQVERGAPADVVVTADESSMGRLLDDGRTDGRPVVVARNRLVVVVPPGNPEGVTTLADTAREGLLLVLAGPDVPAGRYAESAYRRAGVAVPPAAREADVTAAVTRVALGEADVTVAYATDVESREADLDAVPLPDALQPDIAYPAAVLADSAEPDEARAFVALLRSPAGRRIFADHGFGAA